MSGSDSKYTDALEERRALSERRIAQVKQLDGRDEEIARRLRLSGEDRMAGPLPLDRAGEPDERHHAAPVGYLKGQVASAREKIRAANQAIGDDAKDVTDWLGDLNDWIDAYRERHRDDR